MILLVFLAVVSLKATASGVQKKQDTLEIIQINKLLIAKISNCRILAINGHLAKQTKFHEEELNEFDDYYYELKVYYSGKALGFLAGVSYQMGMPNPTVDEVKKLAIELYARQCGMLF